jgi:hypothetical protein
MFNYRLGMTQGGGMGNIGGFAGGGLLGNIYGGPQQGQAQPQAEGGESEEGTAQQLSPLTGGLLGQFNGLGIKASDTMGNMGALGQFVDPMTIKKVF